MASNSFKCRDLVGQDVAVTSLQSASKNPFPVLLRPTELKQVPINEIFTIESNAFHISAKRRAKAYVLYQNRVTLLSLSALKWLDETMIEKGESITKVDEYGLFNFLSSELRKDPSVSFKVDNGIIAASEKGMFDCYSSSVLFADVLSRMGVRVEVAYVPGHMFLEGSTHRFETTAVKTPCAIPKEHKLQYSKCSRAPASSIAAATWIQVGDMYSKLGQPLKSLASFENALSIDSINIEAIQNKAVILNKMDFMDNAILLFKELTSRAATKFRDFITRQNN